MGSDMAFRISGFKDSIGVLTLAEADAEVAVRVAAEWIENGWSDVTLTNEETGHVLDAKRIAGAFSALRARD